jgi:drug/metabolite transporter (DMT)-like permease
MTGALVMLWNPETGVPWPEDRADWFALTAGFAFALSNVATRAVQDVSVAAKVLCVWGGVTAMALIMITVLAAPIPQISLATFSGAVALGFFGILVMTVLIQYGVTRLPVYRAAVITFVELVAGAVSQALLTDELVTLREWGGGALIVLGAYLAARASNKDA